MTFNRRKIQCFTNVIFLLSELEKIENYVSIMISYQIYVNQTKSVAHLLWIWLLVQNFWMNIILKCLCNHKFEWGIYILKWYSRYGKMCSLIEIVLKSKQILGINIVSLSFCRIKMRHSFQSYNCISFSI